MKWGEPEQYINMIRQNDEDIDKVEHTDDDEDIYEGKDPNENQETWTRQ